MAKSADNTKRIERKCSVVGCEKRDGRFTSRMCNMHYLRMKRHGDPHARKKPANGEVMAWINQVALTQEADECLLWPFYRHGSTGYAFMNFRGRPCHASRAVCILAHGEPPFPKAEAAHSCGRGHEGCVSKHCLSWKTSKENSADKIAHGTRLRGTQLQQSKFSEEQVIAIFCDPRSQRVIAAEYGCVQQSVSRIKRGLEWGWLTADLTPTKNNKQPSGEENGNSKFTAEVVRQIYLSADPPLIASRLFGTSRKTVEDIRRRRTWRATTDGL